MHNVFISHPGLQHAHQLAWALHERELLHAFWSAVPVVCDSETLPFWLPASYTRRVKKVEIPRKFRRHPMIFQGLLRVGSVLPSGFSREDYAHRIFHLFDWWVAKHIAKIQPKVVIAYENSAYHTFRAAKAIGARCILDAPSLHHLAGARLIDVKPTPYLAEINRRKDEEVALADMILTCSPLAAEGYLEAGVPSEKVRPTLLGATLPKDVSVWSPHARPLHFIFAGVLSHRKAIDVILAAFRRLGAEALPYRLSFVGGQGELGWVEEIEQTPNAKYYPGVAQAELFHMLAEADCLLLPSRFDSFGMVVAEAMACGTPAIVSTQTGAKAMIEQFPGSGWVVTCDEDNLYRCVKERIENRGSLFAAREHALGASRHFTWQAYRERVGTLIQDWMH
ncbi:glycosyltransferase family 4 protein [Glaciimonas sp. GG7]